MFKELFYWMSTRLAKIPTNDDPPLNAYFLIGLLQSLNIGTIYIIVQYFAKVHFAKYSHIYLLFLITIMAIVLPLINAFTIYKKRKDIFKKYKNVTPKRKAKGLIFFWLYVLLSIILFFTATANLITKTY